MAGIRLFGVRKSFPGGPEAVAGVDLEIRSGELFALVGPSGSGKTTLLRLLAGLEAPDSGEIHFGGRRVDGLPPRDRDVAMVFQQPSLYPYMNVERNLGAGARARGLPRPEVRARVAEAAAMLGLSELIGRRPAELSGGQRQRVALGRALVRRPSVFLLDEPMSALDPPLRSAVRAELVEVHRTLGATTVVVTHDQAEALALGDRVGVLDGGRLLQVGSPREVHDRPASRAVARFIGDPPMNVLPCRLETGDGRARITLDGAGIVATLGLADSPRGLPGGPLDLGFRAEDASVGSDGSGGLTIAGPVRRVEYRGHDSLAFIGVGPHEVALRVAPGGSIGVGATLAANLDPSRCVWFDRGTGLRLGGPGP